ncbi:MAG: MazG family protein, partial [Bacteroidales bacterium]|nr:MazG family protein [Bacteroidales bacterium]
TVSRNWEKLKLKEKDGNKSVLSGVPDALPALIKAYRIQGKAKGVGFDWDTPEGVWDKVREETEEFRKEVENNDRDKMEAEFGDMMFSLINLARQYKINPEDALERTNKKFIRRFNYLESQTIAKGLDLKDMTLPEMDKFWDEAKALEREGKLE